MKALVQRVKKASVSVDGSVISTIDTGILVLVGIHREDTDRDIRLIVEKSINLRIFDDENGVMNRSLIDVGGKALVISQFTLYGKTRKGRRPSYNSAAGPELAREIYDRLRTAFRETSVEVCFGKFQTHMDVELINDGPVTLMIDSMSGSGEE